MDIIQMGALLLLGLLGLVGALSISSSADHDPFEPQALTGTQDQDDLLVGGQGDDTLTGNFGDLDVLDGRGGDDLLVLQNENTGTGGTGQDIFDVTDGAKAVITDFDPQEDSLQILFLRNDEASLQESALRWQVTNDGVALHALRASDSALSEQTHLVTLQGLTSPPQDVLVLLEDERALSARTWI